MPAGTLSARPISRPLPVTRELLQRITSSGSHGPWTTGIFPGPSASPTISPSASMKETGWDRLPYRGRQARVRSGPFPGVRPASAKVIFDPEDGDPGRDLCGRTGRRAHHRLHGVSYEEPLLGPRFRGVHRGPPLNGRGVRPCKVCLSGDTEKRPFLKYRKIHIILPDAGSEGIITSKIALLRYIPSHPRVFLR